MTQEKLKRLQLLLDNAATAGELQGEILDLTRELIQHHLKEGIKSEQEWKNAEARLRESLKLGKVVQIQRGGENWSLGTTTTILIDELLAAYEKGDRTIGLYNQIMLL